MSYVFLSSDPGIIKPSVSVSKLGNLGLLISPLGVCVECCVRQMWIHHLLLLPFLEYVPKSKCVPWWSGSERLASLAMCKQEREVSTAENSRGVLPACLGWIYCMAKVFDRDIGHMQPFLLCTRYCGVVGTAEGLSGPRQCARLQWELKGLVSADSGTPYVLM